MIDLTLSSVIGKKVADIKGYMSREFGDPTFKLTRVLFEDGTAVDVEGEHDMPYICTDSPYFIARFEAAAGE